MLVLALLDLVYTKPTVTGFLRVLSLVAVSLG